MENLITVLLADDTLIAREGWKAILEPQDDIVVVGEATRAQEVLRKVMEHKPQIILMDLKWFGDTTAGWTTIQEIKHHVPETKIIAVTAYEQLIPDARRAGADAALTKTFTGDDLLGLIRELPHKTSKVNFPSLNSQVDSLTQREEQVLLLLSKGYKDKEIAEKLTIAVSTAKNHVKKIYEKLGVRNRLEAANKARKMGLLE